MLNKLAVSQILIVLSACFATAQSYEFISEDPNDIKFYLFPNPENVSDYEELEYLNVDSVNNSRFMAGKKTIILTHGFTNNFLSDMPQVIVQAYLSQGFANDTNIITTDWGDLAGYRAHIPWPPVQIIETLPLYIGSRLNVPKAGKRLQEFISFLQNNSFISGPQDVHLVGHSLGAHVSGLAGMFYAQNTSTKLARITGTDPAGPGFQLNPINWRLDPTDAEFVDVVHSNQGEFGFLGCLGQVDFFVNGGGPIQPGCELAELIDPGCSHRKAPHYFARSITDHSIQGFDKPLLFGKPRTPPVTFGEYCSLNSTGPYKVRLVLSASE